MKHKFVEKVLFPHKCDVCKEPASHIVANNILCKACMGELMEQACDAIKED